MTHTYHIPELTGRHPGPAACPNSVPRSESYWKMLAPHLDSTRFMERMEDVKKHGSVVKAERACTPTKPYRIPYVQSKKTVGERHNMWPPGTGPKPDEKKVDEYLKEGWKLEKEASKIIPNRTEHDFVREEKRKRIQLLHSEAERYYTMASSCGSPAGEKALRKLQGRAYQPSEAERARTSQALYRPSVKRKPRSSQSDDRPSPMAFIAKMVHQRKKDEIMKDAEETKGKNPRVFESASSPHGKDQIIWDSDSDGGGLPEPRDLPKGVPEGENVETPSKT